MGISIVQMLLTEGTARAHEALAADISRSNLALQSLPHALSPDTPSGLAILNAEVTRQAAMIGYVQDFRIMMFLTLANMPLLLFVRKPRVATQTLGSYAPH